MSHFLYGEHSSKRIGVWLRYESNPDIISLVKSSKNKRFFDSVRRVVVAEYDATTQEVWLMVFCINFIDVLRKKHRYNVFYLKTPIKPWWICEGDLGVGLVL